MSDLPPVNIVEGLLRRIVASRGYVSAVTLSSWAGALGYSIDKHMAGTLLDQFVERGLLYHLHDKPGGLGIIGAVVYLPEEDQYVEICELPTVELYELLCERLKHCGSDVIDMISDLAERVLEEVGFAQEI